MSAFQALDAARAAGIEVRLHGKDLIVSAASKPPANVIDMLRRHKRSIMGLLQPTSAPIIPSTDITGSASGDITGSRSGDITGWPSGGISASSNITVPRRPQGDEWHTEDWLGLYDEKAAIGEYDHGLPRPAAEALAFDCCVAEWLYRHAVTSPPGSCPICDEADRPNDDLLPVGLGGGQVWLHFGCSAAWRAGRIAEAVEALALMGIAAPPGSSVTSEETTPLSKATGSTGHVGWED